MRRGTVLGHRHRAQPGRARARERGAALVELAIVSMFLVVLLAGTFDYGQGWRTGLAVNEGARAGARVGSAMGDDELADYYALSAARSSLASSGKLAGVQKVVIYRSATADGSVPSSCATSDSSSAKCIIIDGEDFIDLDQSDFDTATGCMESALQANWCPTSRNTVQLTADYFGIWIRLEHTKVFTFTGSTLTVTRDAVMRLEPRDVGS